MTTKQRIARAMEWIGGALLIAGLVFIISALCYAAWVEPARVIPGFAGALAIAGAMYGMLSLHEWLSRDE